MPRPFPPRSAGFTLLLLLPALPLALLCRGRTPSRFDAKNLPAWERQTMVPHHHLSRSQHHSTIRALKHRKEAAFG